MSVAALMLDRHLQAMPIIAILRGLAAGEVIDVGEALLDAGISVAEVPLNSPDPCVTIAIARAHFGKRLMIGAGTVLTVDDVARVADAGGQFCVMPNVDVAVIAACLEAGLVPVPGFLSATEANLAVAAGASRLKAYPVQAGQISAVRAVLPSDIQLFAVGGATPADVSGMLGAGATGFGVGGDLYRPGRSAGEVGVRAAQWVAAVRAALSMRVEEVCNPQAMIGEGPVEWRGRILWVDPLSSRLLAFDLDRCDTQAWSLTEPVWSLAATPAGDLVGNAATHFVEFDPESMGIRAGPAIALGPGCRLNDLVVDSRGGLWAGSMHRGLLAGVGGIFHAASPHAPVRQVATGLGVANGMAFSADGSTLFVIDTLQRTLLAYPVYVDEGTLGEPVVVTDFLGIAGKPDGMAIDADGHLWVAMWGGGQIVQIAADGVLMRRVELPAPHPGSLCIATDGRLYVTTARARLGEQALLRNPGSGGLFRVSVR